MSQLVEHLGLLYSNARELNKVIDDQLPGRPSFQSRTLVIGGKTLYFHYRDMIQCTRALFRDPRFAEGLILAPEHHFTDEQRTCRVYTDMHTGDWWWAAQVRP